MAKRFRQTQARTHGRRRNPSHRFSEVPSVQRPRSSFRRDHPWKTTFSASYLVPIYADEVLPGDTFNYNATIFARLATPIVPFMDTLVLDTHYFFVPLRLVWDNFQKFMGEQIDPDDSTDFLVPQVEGLASDCGPRSMAAYFGLPQTGQYPNPTDPIPSISALHFRAYNLIYNEWFRDQNLQDSLDVPRDDGPDDLSDYQLMRRNKRHDYFTSGLPWPQKGPGVELPVAGYAPVIVDPNRGTAHARGLIAATGTPNPVVLGVGIGSESISDGALYAGNNESNSIYLDPNGTLVADMGATSAVTINEMREAFQFQRMLERDARGGTRYTEILRAHFGVVSPDSRLQRPEYLGGGSQPMNVQPVPQTSSTDGITPQGNLSGYATVASMRNGFTHSFVEHGIILGLASVRADLSYQQGIHRMWSRRTKHDFYWPALAHLGEQPILNKELYALPASDDRNDESFGYQERWAEYRYYPGRITGQLNSVNQAPLDMWHLAQKFDDLPVLNEEFIADHADNQVNRVIAVQDEPFGDAQIVYDSFVRLRCARPMPVYSVPGLIDHF